VWAEDASTPMTPPSFADKSSWCRFLNHAGNGPEENNVIAFIQSKIGGGKHTYPRMYTRTIKDIEIGEEPCLDYSMEKNSLFRF